MNKNYANKILSTRPIAVGISILLSLFVFSFDFSHSRTRLPELVHTELVSGSKVNNKIQISYSSVESSLISKQFVIHLISDNTFSNQLYNQLDRLVFNHIQKDSINYRIFSQILIPRISYADGDHHTFAIG